MPKMNNLDELRAVFFISVLLFHLFPKIFPYGYLGVDLFFVLSGFLMQSIMRTRLSLRQKLLFLRNRVFRIFLPKIFSIFVVVPFSVLLFPPDILENFGQSMVAASLGLENIFFYLTTNYWAAAGIEKPLLHFWSLGVEIQFYILFTVLCLFNLNTIIIWVTLSICGLLFNYIYIDDESFNFYMLSGRLYLFCLGIAAADDRLHVKIAGLCLTFFCLMIQDFTTAFFIAAVTLGIFGFQYEGWPRSTLKFIGKRSYSYYIAHWLVISVFWILTQTKIDIYSAIILVLVIGVYGELSYRLTELWMYRTVFRKSTL
jgi:peptidoglycan/LPS O-acetylase OafA/YrhL